MTISDNQWSSMFKNYDAQQAKAEYDKGTEFIDIREQYEYDEIRIPGAKLIPMSMMNARWQELPKDKDVIIYCRTGSRSASLLFQLSSMGYSNLINMSNGIVEWYEKEFPVEFGNE